MTAALPLTVRLSTVRDYGVSGADSPAGVVRFVSQEIRDLTMRWTDPGGYASCQVSLSRPLILQPEEIAYYGFLTVYDARNGGVVWEGRLEDPVRSAGTQGEVWDLAAVGGQAHTHDITKPVVYIDQPMRNLENWASAKGATDETKEVSADVWGRHMQFPQGMTVQAGGIANLRYWPIQRAGQKLAYFSYFVDSGAVDGSYDSIAVCSNDGLGASDIPRIDVMSIGAIGPNPRQVTFDFTNGRNVLDVRLRRKTGIGAATIPDDHHWTVFYDLTVVAMRYEQDDFAGTEKTTGYTGTVTAAEVVEDVLVRYLPQYDLAGARIDSSGPGVRAVIDQLAYPDGADASRILSDLMTFEAGFTWRAWELTSDNFDKTPRFRFEWTTVPLTVRYEADVIDGFDSGTSTDGLHNQVTVRYVDKNKRARTVTVTSEVSILDDAGLTRTGFIDLGDEAGTAAQAQRAGEQWLIDKTQPSNAGRLRIARPILDLETGRMVQPWEIRPGLIRVRGILPRPDVINATTRDAVTIFRIVGCDYNASDGAATLELDSYPRSVSHSIAALQEALRPGGSRDRWRGWGGSKPIKR